MPIDFDNTGALIAALNLPTRESMREKVTILADAARAEIIRLAKERLNSTERSYVSAVQPVQVRGATALIILPREYVLANMVENGWPPHDLRTTVLLSPKAKMSKAGFKYLAVPFTVMLEGNGKNGPVLGSPYATGMGAVGELMAESIRRNIRPRAQALKASVTANGKTSWGGRLSEADAGPLLKPHHTTSIYTGMVRMQSSYGKATQSTYGNFRMISTNPDTHSGPRRPSWQHPGIVPRHFFVMAEAHIRKMIPFVMEM